MMYKELMLNLKEELTFRTSRSSGAGGQHVNKTQSRVELIFDVDNSRFLSSRQKDRLRDQLSTRITAEGLLTLASEKTRSQFQNKEDCVNRFESIIISALKPEKKRIPTKPSFSSRKKRLEKKKMNAKKKEQRRKPGI